MLAFAQLSRPAPQAARPAPSRGAARVAAPQRPPAARFLRLVAAAKREDDRFDSVFTSRSDAALAYVCVDCGCVGAAEPVLSCCTGRASALVRASRRLDDA